MPHQTFNGAHLRAIRERTNLTPTDLAAAIGRSAWTVIKIESGESRPSLQTLERLAVALDTPVESFFADDCNDLTLAGGVDA